MDFLFLFQKVDLEDTKPEDVGMNLFELIAAGGPLSIAIFVVLVLLAVIAVYIFAERYFNISRATKIDENFMNNIRANVGAGNISAARALCQNTDSPMSRMVEKGLMLSLIHI